MPRLDHALIAIHPELSRRKARDVIEKGQVLVDGEVVTEPGRAIGEGARVGWDKNRKALPRARSSLPILHRDEHVIVVDKPAGLLTMPSGPGAVEDTALLRVRDYVSHLTPRRPYVGLVHRLDRDTSGALAFALDPKTREALRALFRAHRIERRYAAIVEGAPRQDRGVVDLPIRNRYEAGRRGVARAGENAKPALTRYTVLERFTGAALLDLELGTGRQHQIRIHLAHLGAPILGDPVYRPGHGRRPPVSVRRQMLHARRLAFTHPASGRVVSVESPIPDDFRRALKALRQLR